MSLFEKSSAGAPRENRPAKPLMAVNKLPICEFCLDRSEYYGKTINGKDAYMCARHFKRMGQGSGAGEPRRMFQV